MIEKKWYLCIVCFLFLLGLSGCSLIETQTKSENEIEIELVSENTENKKNKENSDFSHGDLQTMFEEMSNENVVIFLYEDYNQDGIHEAFVVTKEDDYKLWYMSGMGCELIQSGIDIGETEIAEILDYGTKSYLLLQRRKGKFNNTLVYTVDNDSHAVEADISGIGYIRRSEGRELSLQIPNTEDGGHVTYLTYYLYHMLDEGFKEYGAIPISEEQFLEFEGAQDIIDTLYEEYADAELTFSFLYRSNHYINLNVVITKNGEVQYKTMTLKYDTRKVSGEKSGLMDGRMETAVILEIATFPTAFRHPEQQIMK